MRRVRALLTYANVMSSIAVFLVLGGGAYAAVTLPRNSVGPRQIRANAVTSAKVRNHSLLARDFKAGQLKRGRTGLTGPRGPAGDTGPAGKDFTPGATLPVGMTETGQFGAFGAGTGFAGDAIAFRPALATTPDPGSGHFLPAGGPFTGVCPGPGQAASGHLCVYQQGGTGLAFGAIYADEGASQQSGRAARDGFQIYFTAGSSGGSAHGTWAVTG